MEAFLGKICVISAYSFVECVSIADQWTLQAECFTLSSLVLVLLQTMVMAMPQMTRVPELMLSAISRIMMEANVLLLTNFNMYDEVRCLAGLLTRLRMARTTMQHRSAVCSLHKPCLSALSLETCQ